MTVLSTPADNIAQALDVRRYAARFKVKGQRVHTHPVVDKIYTNKPVAPSAIVHIANDANELRAYLNALLAALPFHTATAFHTDWAAEASANGLMLATKLINAIAPLPEQIFFFVLAKVFRPAESGGLDFSHVSTKNQSAEEIDGDWFECLSAYVRDLIAHRNASLDAATHIAGERLYALGCMGLAGGNKVKASNTHIATAACELLLGDKKLSH